MGVDMCSITEYFHVSRRRWEGAFTQYTDKRLYSLFAVLAEFRASNIPPIKPECGWPDRDIISVEADTVLEDIDESAHTFSYYTLAELLAHNWEAAIKVRDRDSGETSQKTYRELAGEEFMYFLECAKHECTVRQVDSSEMRFLFLFWA